MNTGIAQLNSLNVLENSSFNGLVGIGVVTPSEKLHVGGNLKVDGGISSNTFNSSNLTAGQFTSGPATFTDNISVAKDAFVTGKVGIGIPTPSESLDVNGNIKLSGSVTGSSINVSNATINQNLNVTGNSILSGSLSVNGTFSATTLSFDQINSNGNTVVGQNLTVNGTTQLTGDLNLAGNMSAGIITASEFRTTDGGSAFNFTNAIISQSLAVATAQPIPANYKLAVGGAIIATGIDIKVPSKWPDYVFAPNYERLSIGELKKYIDQNQHLPSVPSAKEMEEKKNYSVSEMDAKMLEKIEELTLYIIELEARVNDLEKKKK